MIGVQSYTDKALAAVERNRAAVERSRRRLAQHDIARPSGDDADALFAWKRERRDLEDRVESDREALAFAEVRAEQARIEAATRAADAEHAAEQKRAAADAKLVHEANTLATKLATKLAEIEASRARTDAVNAKRGSRPWITDAEARVRGKPAQTSPAVFEERELWVDAEGRTPGELRANGRGELEPSDHGTYERKRVRVQVQAEVFAPASIPRRLAEEIRLVDVEGRVIWG